MSAVLPSASTAHDAAAPATPVDRLDRAFMGHPVGLGWLAFCEFWERFSYYGMQALLVLYLSNHLFKPEHIGGVAGMGGLRALLESVVGPLDPMQLAALVGGLYAGLVYLTPLAGGLLADRWLGRTRAVTLGAVLMAIGHFLMAFDMSFLPAIASLLCGVGLFKGNIAAQVGALYRPDDKRSASAFQIFMLAVQVAVIASPIVCGTLGEKIGWHWGFGSAGVGMVIGLLVYLAGRKYLPPEPKRERQAAIEHTPLSRREWQRLGVLVLLLPVLMLSIVGNQQFQIGYPLWAEKHMDMVLFGWDVPVTWLQAVDALISFGTMLASIAFWRWWATRRVEPDEMSKIAIGALLAACGPAMMIFAAHIIDDQGQRISLVWTLAYTLLNNLGFANILPVGLSLYSRVSPRRLTGVVLGCYYLHLFIGNTFVGWLAGFLTEMSAARFWALHAGLVVVAGVLMLLCKLLFGKVLSDDQPAAAGSR